MAITGTRATYKGQAAKRLEVGVQLVRPLPRSASPAAAHRRDGIQHRRQHLAVVLEGPTSQHAERCASGIDRDVALAAGLAAVGRVRPCRRSPPLAGTDALSSAVRRQSIWPAACRCSSSTRCSAAQTSA